MLGLRAVVSCVWCCIVVVGLASVAHAQLGIGCYSFGACREGLPFGMVPRACSDGRDCDDPSACVFESPEDLTGFCLVPTSACQYCLLADTTTCPEAAIGSRERQRPMPTIEGCAYAICGDSRYVVDGDTPDFPSLEPCFTGPFLNWWGGGDCDEDGIINDLDRGEALCFENHPVTRIEEGRVTCDRGQFVSDPLATGMTAGMCSIVSPDPMVRACVDEGVLPFGICCTQLEECPTVLGMGVRCVRLPSTDGQAGVCTYGLDVPPVDTSCLSARSGALCDDPAGLTAYQRWADGNCDADCDPLGSRNAYAEQVCSCRPDAGVDAAAPDAARAVDASVPTELDAAASIDATVDTDTGGSTPRFGGWGVSCRAGATRGRGPRAWLALLVLLGLARARRRR